MKLQKIVSNFFSLGFFHILIFFSFHFGVKKEVAFQRLEWPYSPDVGAW